MSVQLIHSVSAASVECLRTSNHWRRAEGQTIGGVGQVYLSPGRPGAALNSDLLRCKTSGRQNVFKKYLLLVSIVALWI